MKRRKSERKSNTHHQKPSNLGDFSFNVTKVAVSQICRSVGFRRIQVSAMETLTLVATKYMEALAKSAVSFSNAANRTQSNLLDIINALHDMSFQVGFLGASTLHDDTNNCLLKSAVLEDLSGFVNSTDEIPFAKPTEREIERKREGKVKTISGNLLRRKHVPEWLPDFPDVKVRNESCRKKRVNGEELWEDSNFVLGCQVDGFDQEEKKNGNNNCVDKLAKDRPRVKFRINGGGKRMVRLKNNTNKDAEAESEFKKPVKSKENQTLTYKRRKR